MIYKNIKEGTFVSRPNRFIANVEIDGEVQVCHVKNTGRCMELLVPGTKVYLEESDNSSRKTKFDLIAVLKGDKLFNIDSGAPNKVFHEWLKGFSEITLIKPECTYKNSRFDFYIETKDAKAFVEIKGVTLEKDGVHMFPDAPTERGVKHIKELISCVKEGFGAAVAFIVQTDFGEYFTPNESTHPEFASALREAEKSGVKILCFNCNITPDKLTIKEKMKVIL